MNCVIGESSGRVASVTVQSDVSSTALLVPRYCVWFHPQLCFSEPRNLVPMVCFFIPIQCIWGTCFWFCYIWISQCFWSGYWQVPGEGNGNSLQYYCLENPMDRGAWQAIFMGSQRVGQDWLSTCIGKSWLCHAWNKGCRITLTRHHPETEGKVKVSLFL